MKVKYVGPEKQVNYEVGRESDQYTSELVPEKTYDVSDDLGKRLIASSAFFVKVKESNKSDEEQNK